MKPTKIKKLSCLILVAALVLTGMSVPTQSAMAAGTDGEYESSNVGDQNYFTSRWSSPMYSYLTDIGDGYMRVEYTGDDVAVEYYDSDFSLESKKSVPMELTLFGGFFEGEDAYYIVFGQSNPDEDNSVEVIRTVKYDKSWNRVGAASLYGANTYIPFDAGSCRMTEYGGYLYVRTCHEMYAISGVHHQANMTFEVDEGSMEITDYAYKVSNSSTGYVSHSFNQFIMADDAGNLIALDHGDAYPRSFVLFKYNTSAGNSTFSGYNRAIDLMTFQGSIGNNTTKASVGGLEYSSTSYLVAGNSVTQDENWSTYSVANVFVSVTSRDNFSSSGTEIKWITDYDMDAGLYVSTPQLVKMDSDSFLLLWTETDSSSWNSSYKNKNTVLKYVFLDGEGNETSDIFEVNGHLSDCQPIVSDGKAVWYTTGATKSSGDTAPIFYTIDADGTYSCTAMETPTITSINNTASGIKLTWEPTEGATNGGYRVYRKSGSGSYKKIADIDGDENTSYTDTAVKNKYGKTYTYKVVAYYDYSSYTAKSTAKIARMEGTSLSSVKNVGSGTLKAKWTAASQPKKITGYQIQYSVSSSFSSSTNVNVKNLSKTSKKLTGLTAGKTYYVRIRTYYRASNGKKYYSAWSSAKSVNL